MLEDRKLGEGKKERKPSGCPFAFLHPPQRQKKQNNNSILPFCKRLGEKVRKDLWDKLQTCCLKLAAGLFCRDSAIIIAWFFRSRKSCCTASAAFCASRRTPDCRGSISATVPPAAMPRPSVSKKDRTCIVLPPFTLFCTVSMPAPAQKNTSAFCQAAFEIAKMKF